MDDNKKVLFDQMQAAGLERFALLLQNEIVEGDHPSYVAEFRHIVEDWCRIFDLHIMELAHKSMETAERDLQFKLAALECHGITGRAVPGLKKIPNIKKERRIQKQGKVTQTVSVGSKQDVGPGSTAEPVIEAKLLPPTEVPVQFSKVSFALGITKSIGNFEFARIDISAEDFCAPDQKVQAWDRLAEEVGNCLEKAVKEIDLFKSSKASQSKTSPFVRSNNAQATPVTVVDGGKKAEGTADIVTRKALHSEVKMLSQQGLLDYGQAVEKIQQTILNQDFAIALLEKLRANDVSFFQGVAHDPEETEQIDALDDDIR